MGSWAEGTPLVSALQRQRRTDTCETEARPVYIGSSRPARAIGGPWLKKKKKCQQVLHFFFLSTNKIANMKLVFQILKKYS